MRKDICGKCAVAVSKDYKLYIVHAEKDMKVTCSVCGRRKYGKTYEVELK